MLYNDEYTFMVKYKQKIQAIRVPRNSTDNGKNDFSTSELYKKVKEEFHLSQVKLTLNNKKIPCNKNFSIFFLQYLPYQRIQAEEEDNDDAPKENRELTIEYDTKELLQSCQSEKETIKYNLKGKTTIKYLSILDLKKKFTEDISKSKGKLINPYELIFTTKTRYIYDDENAFYVSSTPLIATYRSDNNALYPLHFQILNDKQPVKKWYNKNTTFGQIAFDLFSENYYKYKFDFNNADAKRKYGNKKIAFSTFVGSIKLIEENEIQILNDFKVTENNERYYRFDFYNSLQGNEIYLDNYNKYRYSGRIPCSGNGNEINLIYEIQQKIKSDIIKNIKCDKFFFLEKYNLKANINDYGNPFEKYFHCQQLYLWLTYTYKIHFYNDDETKFLYMKSFSTVFNLRYAISVFKDVNIENVIIFYMDIKDFKNAIEKNNTLEGLDDLTILKSTFQTYTNYIVYIINSESNNTYISPKLLSNYNEQENSELSQNEHDKSGQKVSNSTLYPVSSEPSYQYFRGESFESTYGNINMNSISKPDLPIISQEPAKTPDNEEPVKPKINKRKTNFRKPTVTNSNSNDENQKVPEYIKLNFTYKESSKKLQILQLSTDDELSTLERKIRRFYKINTKIDFYYEEDHKNKINNLKLSQIEDPSKNIMIVKTNIELKRKIYYQFYENEEMFEIDNVKTVDELRKKIYKDNKSSVGNQIDIIFGGKILDDDTKLDRFYSEDDQNVLTIYNNRPIFDFSGTVNLKNQLI